MREQMLSVGIDVGTSTTQLVFSRLIIENLASDFSVPRIEIVEKAVIYRSKIYFTPLVNQTRLDAPKIREIIQGEYEMAGIDQSLIDIGAVIITGETARKENAQEVLESLSGLAGDFVVATAGPDLESIIAGKGAGAHTYSKAHSTTVVNMDIGGGTSNLAVFSQGEIKDTGCLDIGGRLVKIDLNTHKITYIMPKIMELIAYHGLPLAVGTVASVENIWPLAQAMADILAMSVGTIPQNPIYQKLLTHKGLRLDEPIACISFSGGVADYIYGQDLVSDPFLYGDMGILLGQAIKESILCQAFEVVQSSETIRATVVGAGSHTTEVSGSTITYSKDLFPIKNIPILKLNLVDEKGMGQEIREKLGWFGTERVAVGFRGLSNPSFKQISAYAKELVWGLEPAIQSGKPIIIVVAEDMAMVLGQAIRSLMGHEQDIVCLDGVQVEDGDYIDIGRPIAEGRVLPVVVKTIIFNK